MLRFPQMNRWLDDLSAYRHVGLDTNVIIYFLEDVVPYRELAGQVLHMMDRGLIVGSISTVVEAEVLVKPLRDRNRRAQETIELFFRNSPNPRHAGESTARWRAARRRCGPPAACASPTPWSSLRP